MKRKSLFITIGVMAVFLVAAFLAGKAFATVNCFTDTIGNWAETEICWMKDHGISAGYGGGLYGPNDFVTRAQMAVFMKNQAEVPPVTGQIMITPGNGEWLKRTAIDNTSFDNLGWSVEISKATAGSAWITIQPSIPTVLYGRRMQLVGVDFCYRNSANTDLWDVDIDRFSTTDGIPHYYGLYADGTDRSDTACRYYELTTPYTLTKFDGVVFYAHVNWAVAGAIFEVSRTTFVLQPTDTLTSPFSPPLTP